MNDFDSWNELKKRLDALDEAPDRFPQKGEVWMSNLGKNIGFEQNGIGERFSRPLLVVKKFNTHMFWAVPLSTKQKNFDFYYNFVDSNNKAVSIILAQLKLVSVKRVERKLYDLDKVHFQRVKKRLQNFLS